MRFGIKGGSIAVLTTAVLATAACSSSGQIGASGAGTSAPGSPAASTGKTAVTPPNTALAPSTSGASSANSTGSTSSSGGTTTGGKSLTTDQISANLLTDKDDPGYTYDASEDGTSVTDTQDVVSSGGGACQTFVDAENGLSTKYGTTAEVDRELTKSAEGHVIEDSVLAMPSPDKALAMVSDLSGSLQSCKKLSVAISGKPGSMELSAIPQLMKHGQAGYLNYLTVGGKTVLLTADLVQVGSAVSVVVLLGPVTNDKTELGQMGSTMGHLSDLQVARLKKAQGLG
ncbi:hypothetical protein Caci_8774 [Catenulispora acidiphila DSM 44928]|uniref:PknH-like extracellular domain-containing protein n=1 Tax=Catenulispora acidiphila (strain DSM 44928 / JCM 14897 / NBRC 102108 / NRRL B-24433 / ID139908) TaxID=479433 RepID=C7Q252_CATAD|nr:sensor domain-containing protein [Catenulispora acidiphila]ACU77589.1 hypothetical protein Caci_8774 [Catenulispora acidiphila DSM 44928]